MKMKEQMKAIKNKMDVPMLTLFSSSVPEVKKWDVGGKYKLEIEVEEVEKSNQDGMVFEDEDFEQEEEASSVIKGVFKVNKVKVL